MGRDSLVHSHAAELTVENYLDGAGNIALPEGITLMTSLHRNIAELGDSVSYRYLDYSRGQSAVAVELTWTELGAGNIAVPLFAPELPGHVERLEVVLADATPSVVLTTTAVAESVTDVLRKIPRQRRPRVIAVDAVPDS